MVLKTVNKNQHKHAHIWTDDPNKTWDWLTLSMVWRLSLSSCSSSIFMDFSRFSSMSLRRLCSSIWTLSLYKQCWAWVNSEKLQLTSSLSYFELWIWVNLRQWVWVMGFI